MTTELRDDGGESVSEREEQLWRVLDARDRAFARAHAAYQSAIAEAREKDEEIRRLTAWARELEIAPREKDAEIQMLTRHAAERLAIIQRLERSWEYRLGFLLLHPWQVLRTKL